MRAIGLNRGTVIARKMKFGLPSDPGEAQLDYSGTVVEITGEVEEALEREDIPRERRDSTRAYFDATLKGYQGR